MFLKFTKMHGLGNDFMVVDGVRQKIYFSTELIRKLSDRHFGIGFDQLLLVEPPYSPDVDFHYRIFNQDGSEVQMCGNGARCFARFVRQKGLINKSEITVSTISGILKLKVNDNDEVTVNMGKPNFEPQALPFEAQSQSDFYDLDVLDKTYKVGCVSMGNPHVVLNVEDVNKADVKTLGPLIEGHKRFPEHVNVGFLEKLNANQIALRVYERGCGETYACGSGACAAVCVGIKQGLLKSPVKVCLKGGNLTVAWDGKDGSVMMTGPAVTVYDGIIEI